MFNYTLIQNFIKLIEFQKKKKVDVKEKKKITPLKLSTESKRYIKTNIYSKVHVKIKKKRKMATCSATFVLVFAILKNQLQRKTPDTKNIFFC